MKNYYSDHIEQDSIELLNQARGTWTYGAPKNDSHLLRALLKRLKGKSKQVLDYTYDWLFDNHQSNSFPAPAVWMTALKHAEREAKIGGNCLDGWYEQVKVGDEATGYRYITKLEKSVLDLVKNYFHKNTPAELAKRAIDKGYFDLITADYRYPINGLTGYVVDNFKAQFVILNKISGEICYQTADSKEFASYKFIEKVNKKGFVCLDLLDKEKLRSFASIEDRRVKSKKVTEALPKGHVGREVSNILQKLKKGGGIGE